MKKVASSIFMDFTMRGSMVTTIDVPTLCAFLIGFRKTSRYVGPIQHSNVNSVYKPVVVSRHAWQYINVTTCVCNTCGRYRLKRDLPLNCKKKYCSMFAPP